MTCRRFTPLSRTMAVPGRFMYCCVKVSAKNRPRVSSSAKDDFKQTRNHSAITGVDKILPALLSLLQQGNHPTGIHPEQSATNTVDIRHYHWPTGCRTATALARSIPTKRPQKRRANWLHAWSEQPLYNGTSIAPMFSDALQGIVQSGQRSLHTGMG